MTIQTKHFIEVSDIVGLRFTCKSCDANLILLLSDGKLTAGETRISQFLDKCPNCHEDWLDINGKNYASILMEATGALNRLRELLYGKSAPTLGVSLMLEVKAEAVREPKRILLEFQDPRPTQSE